MANWAAMGTTIVAWQWLGVPDKYDPPQPFATYDEASAYAETKGGRVEVEYTLRGPDGTTWSLRMWSVPDRCQRDAAIGSVMIDRRYEVGPVHEKDRPTFPNPEEAEAAAQRLGTRTIQERLSFRTPDGDPFETYGTLVY